MPMRRLTRVAVALVSAVLAACSDQQPTSPLRPDAAPDAAAGAAHPFADILILGSSVSGGAGSREAQAATAAGYTIHIASSAEWAAMTAADFSGYEALVIGDPTCRGNVAELATPTANTGVWGPAATGNVIIIGTDPTFHFFQGGAAQLVQKGIEFAAAASRTGAYITTSCYYHSAGPGTAVPMLNGLSALGDFTARGNLGCYDDAYITAVHPALSTVTSASLSNWGCSVHNGFDGWPSDFEVLAIGRGVGAFYTAPDGTQGIPYILARGEGLVVISDIQLTPSSAIGEVGSSHTVTATVKSNDEAVSGAVVTFTIEDGPHSPAVGTATTDANGVASFTYTGTVVGSDGIRARFTDAVGVVQTSGRATMEWTEVSNVPPVANAGGDIVVLSGDPAALDGTGSTDADGTIVSYEWFEGMTKIADGPTASVTLPKGTHTIRLVVTDDDGAADADELSVLVENRAPIALAGADQVVECTAPTGALVSLDGSASSDPDGTIASHEWFLGGSSIASSAMASVTFGGGAHSIMLEVTDNDGATGSDALEVRVEDTTAPTLAVSASPGTLWSPNHKYRMITVTAAGGDACDASVAVAGYVVSNEADDADGVGDGDTIDDIKVTRPDGTVLTSSTAPMGRVPFAPGDKLEVRAERYGTAGPRIYSVVLTATDASGNATQSSATVTVDHDKGK